MVTFDCNHLQPCETCLRIRWHLGQQPAIICNRSSLWSNAKSLPRFFKASSRFDAFWCHFLAARWPCLHNGRLVHEQVRSAFQHCENKTCLLLPLFGLAAWFSKRNSQELKIFECLDILNDLNGQQAGTSCVKRKLRNVESQEMSGATDSAIGTSSCSWQNSSLNCCDLASRCTEKREGWLPCDHVWPVSRNQKWFLSGILATSSNSQQLQKRQVGIYHKDPSNMCVRATKASDNAVWSLVQVQRSNLTVSDNVRLIWRKGWQKLSWTENWACEQYPWRRASKTLHLSADSKTLASTRTLPLDSKNKQISW